MAPAQPTIAANSIRKIFLTETVETTALDNLHLSVAAGESVSVVGPSGSGKSTLLGVLGLMEPPTAGTLSLFGEAVSHHNAQQVARIRQKLGFVFQHFALIDRLSVLENVAIALESHALPSAETRERAVAMLDRVGLSTRMSHRPHQLSGGQQQRVAIARALVGLPRIVFADEPTGNLDSAAGHDVMDVLFELRLQETTIMMVTHDPRVAERADRTLVMEDGRLVV